MKKITTGKLFISIIREWIKKKRGFAKLRALLFLIMNNMGNMIKCECKR